MTDTRYSTGREELRQTIANIIDPRTFKQPKINLYKADYELALAKADAILSVIPDVAQGEQQPAAWRWHAPGEVRWSFGAYPPNDATFTKQPLYAAPQPASNAYSAVNCGAFDLIRLGARAMRLAAEADCGNHSESVQEDAMTSGGLTRADKMKLSAEADAADEIRKQIQKTCEDSALGYLSYMGSEDDIAALKALGVTPDWLYRCENGVPSRAEVAKGAVAHPSTHGEGK